LQLEVSHRVEALAAAEIVNTFVDGVDAGVHHL
jgi:hypothetical protein